MITKLDKKTISDNDTLHKETWGYLLKWKEKFYPKINEFYSDDEDSLFLVQLNHLLKNSKE